MRLLGLPVLLVSALALSGCAHAPDRGAVAERWLLEVTDSEIIREGLTDLGYQIADDALAGHCGSIAYETGLRSNGTDDLVYAWRVTCLTYFESDLTAAQVQETKQLILDRATG